MLKAILKSMRPAQWTKNLVVFAGLLFTNNLFNPPLLRKTIFAFSCFCIISGCLYIINDITDIEKDKLHPLKKQRPITSGQLKISTAIIISIILLVVSLGSSFLINSRLGLIALSYFLLMLMYSLFLQYVVIIDVFIIAFGFVLRAVAGAVTINVKISPWLLVCTILLALFLGLCKRRHELVLLEEKANAHRPVLSKYSALFIDQMVSIVSSATIVSYCMYTFMSETAVKYHHLMLTIPFVMYGVFRYLYLVYKKELGGSPEMLLLKDKPLIVTIALWAITIMAIFYFSR